LILSHQIYETQTRKSLGKNFTGTSKTFRRQNWKIIFKVRKNTNQIRRNRRSRVVYNPAGLIFFSVVQHSDWGLGRFIVQFYRSHTVGHTHTWKVRLLCTNDQLIARPTFFTTHTNTHTHTHTKSMSSAGSELAIPAIK
jgi:hypothetical protein